MDNQPKKTSNYRPEVDGLRGVAVMLVLLFHAGFTTLNGGFIGVDVFFVISGYLITGILVRNCQENKLDYLNFLSKRFFRLYPSLLVTLALTLCLGYLLLSPQHLTSLGEASLAALFSISNISFLQNSGYFADSASTNALLHTWSLGVEQQFYLLWPLVLYLAYKIHRSSLPFVILTIGIVSLAWSQYAAHHTPSAAYFLTHYRVFEFALGGLLIWIEKHTPQRNALLELMLIAGFLLIFYCALSYDENTVFPGLHALLPCLGASLCILAGDAKYLGSILKNKAIVFIGLISYSLYLVHWPIIVFYKYWAFSPLEIHEKALLVVAPFVVAIPLYHFVEKRYRRLTFRGALPKQRGSFLAVLAILASGSAYAHLSNGAYWRINSPIQTSEGQLFYRNQYGGEGFGTYDVIGKTDRQTIDGILIGDSFAGHLMHGLDSFLRQHNLKVISLWGSGCLISSKAITTNNGQPMKECKDTTQNALKLINEHQVPIILAQSWAGAYFWNLADTAGAKIHFPYWKDYHELLAKNILALRQHAGSHRNIIIFGSPPGDGSDSGIDLKSCVERPDLFKSKCAQHINFPDEKGKSRLENIALKKLLSPYENITFIDPYELFCDNYLCRPVLDDELMYSDHAHLSIAGSEKLINHFSDVLLYALNDSIE